MGPRIFPSEDKRERVPVQGNPRGDRVFRVTDSTIQRRTRLILAATAEAAVADDASAITTLGQENVHEVNECVELLPSGPAYHVPPERS